MGLFANLIKNRTVALSALAGGLIGAVGGVAFAPPESMVVAGMLGGAAGLAGGAFVGQRFSDLRGGRDSVQLQAPAPAQAQVQAPGQGQAQNVGDSVMQTLNSQPVQALTGILRASGAVGGAPGAGPGGIPGMPGIPGVPPLGGGRGPFG